MNRTIKTPNEPRTTVWLFDDGDRQRVDELQANGWRIIDRSTMGGRERIELTKSKRRGEAIRRQQWRAGGSTSGETSRVLPAILPQGFPWFVVWPVADSNSAFPILYIL